MTNEEFERDYRIMITPLDELTNDEIRRRSQLVQEELTRQMQVSAQRQPSN